MRLPTNPTWLLAIASSLSLASAQTSTKCNPLTSTCPADPALGRTAEVDFTQGESKEFTATGSPSYESDGAHLAVAQAGDSPTLISSWYLMFGHVEVVMKPAPGVGIVSSFVLQSDDLDEIDFEWLGADNQQVQSNYFGKGQTTSYDRGAFHPNPGNQDGFHTYTVDWTAGEIAWQIDGTTVRALNPQNAAPGQYPQTPMQLKLGIWSGGDSSNAPGTVQWAGGATNYAGGPYDMVVKSVKAQDYSTGTSYTYSDTTGTWKSITSDGGQVNSGGSASDSGSAPAPQVTGVSSGAPVPFDPSHSDDKHSSTPPPATSSSSSSHSSPASPAAAPPAAPAAAGGNVVTGWNQQGFATTYTRAAAGPSPAAKNYDDQDFPVAAATPAPTTASERRNMDNGANKAQASMTDMASSPVATGAAVPLRAGAGAVVGVLAGALLL